MNNISATYKEITTAQSPDYPVTYEEFITNRGYYLHVWTFGTGVD